MKLKRVCGIEIKGADALICILEQDGDELKFVASDISKVSVDRSGSSKSMREFQDAIHDILSSHGVSRVVVKERASKGKFIGAALGFKMEAAIQLLREYEVSTAGNHDFKICDECYVPNIPFKETGLRQYQEQAYFSALYAIYGAKE